MAGHGHRFNPEKAGLLLDPTRKERLPQDQILSLIDIQKGDIVADFGAGNGFFTVPIAQRTEDTVYAVDIEPKMLDGLKEHAESEGVSNIKYVPADLADTQLPDDSVAKIFSSFVMHEVPDLKAVFDEMKRILKEGGDILVLDWEAVESESGPPLSERIPSERLVAEFEANDFAVEKQMINSTVYALVIRVKN